MVLGGFPIVVVELCGGGEIVDADPTFVNLLATSELVEVATIAVAICGVVVKADSLLDNGRVVEVVELEGSTSMRIVP